MTTETDGRMPSGETVGSFIEKCDSLCGPDGVLFFMINCAHSDHYIDTLIYAKEKGEAWVRRIRGVRNNASRMSHAELNKSKERQATDPKDFGASVAKVKEHLPWIGLLGGCCGTEQPHLEELCKAAHKL